MKRWTRIALVAILGITLFWPQPEAQAASLNNFTITDYKIEYVLGKDGQKRSTLKTTETITADFAQRNTNRGIERAIASEYQGRSTSLKVTRVADESGKELPYSTSSKSGNKVVRIGDENTYVYGKQTYVIEYTQRDVTRFFENTANDEFYWDTNGTDWRVPTERLDISLKFTDGLEKELSGKVACYEGIRGSTDRCSLLWQGDAFVVGADNLARGENVTVALGFNQGTFAPYEQSFWEKALHVYLISLVVISFIAVGFIIWLSVRWDRLANRKKELGTIVPEYIPPKDTSVTTAATIAQSASTFSAQLIDFAVRHYIKIYQTKEKKGIWSSAEYDIEIVKDISTLLPEEQEVLRDIFNSKTDIGSRLSLKDLQKDTKLYKRMQDNDKKLESLIREKYSIRHKVPEYSAWFKKYGYVLLLVALVTLNPMMLIAAITAFTLGYTLWPLTDKGLALKRYLEGLKIYISVAEEERLKMLQSPEGAEKVGQSIGADDSSQMVKLYERVLPYAILFGQEKEWNKQLGLRYEASGTNPDWYGGTGSNAVFNAVVFSSLMSNFTTAATYSSPSSSSSGGSGGGGFSGGGGGGGGGGGW